jgi:hypothetical protein
MKIIKKGNINNTVTCDFCDCVYEFDSGDIKKSVPNNGISYSISYGSIDHEYKYVECPCCGHKHYIQKTHTNTITAGAGEPIKCYDEALTADNTALIVKNVETTGSINIKAFNDKLKKEFYK